MFVVIRNGILRFYFIFIFLFLLWCPCKDIFTSATGLRTFPFLLLIHTRTYAAIQLFLLLWQCDCLVAADKCKLLCRKFVDCHVCGRSLTLTWPKEKKSNAKKPNSQQQCEPTLQLNQCKLKPLKMLNKMPWLSRLLHNALKTKTKKYRKKEKERGR